jgi:hypothetical protein
MVHQLKSALERMGFPPDDDLYRKAVKQGMTCKCYGWPSTTCPSPAACSGPRESDRAGRRKKEAVRVWRRRGGTFSGEHR